MLKSCSEDAARCATAEPAAVACTSSAAGVMPLEEWVRGCPPDDGYEDFLKAVQVRFAEVTREGGPLFLADVEDGALFDAFLQALPAGRRQHYRCHACRRFFNAYGGLVRVGEDGFKYSVLWDFMRPDAMMEDVPLFFRDAVFAVRDLVHRAKIRGLFLTEEKVWGTPKNRSQTPPYEWHHLHVVPWGSHVFRQLRYEMRETASQRAAEKLEEYKTLRRGLEEFPPHVVRQAHTLLTGGHLYRSEKCIGVAKWLHNLHSSLSSTKRADVRDNLTWLAAATAPPGYCHVKTGMIGFLLEMVRDELPFNEIKRQFAAKMDPLHYQRPQAPPKAGNVAQAEKVVEQLKSAGALERRFARLEEVQTIWKPEPTTVVKTFKVSTVFEHLKPRTVTTWEIGKSDMAALVLPPSVMTWEKFRREVLHEAEKIEYFVARRPGPYAAIVTAVNPDAPPILQWDREDRRNPFSWYLHAPRGNPSTWNLSPGSHVQVTGIALQPSMWGGEDEFPHQGKSVFFLLEGAKDRLRSDHWGSTPALGGGFFPETLRSEYHAVRSTLEAYANRATVSGYAEATACGLKLEKGVAVSWDCTLRVTRKDGGVLSYTLDRWD